MSQVQIQTIKPRRKTIQKIEIVIPAKNNVRKVFTGNFNKSNNKLPAKYLDAIVCESSLECLRKLPDNCIDLVVTSPPYNFGLDYSDHKDVNTWHDYYDNLFTIFSECIRVVKYGGRIVVNVQPLFSDYIPSHHLVSNFFIDRGLSWLSEIIWDKSHYNCKYTAWGSWKSPASPYLKYKWEFLEVFSKGTLNKSAGAKNADINQEEFKQWVNARWKIAPERHMKKFNHPAMFPEKLIDRVLKLYSSEGDIILDPFNGAGTATCVAAKLHRHYLGIDLSKEYCDTAIERLQEIQPELR